VIFQLFYFTPVVSILPLLIGETAKGNYAPFGSLLGLLLTASPDPVSESAQAIGMFTAVQCNEDAPFASRQNFIAARDQNRRASALAFQVIFNEGFLDVCDQIGLNNPDPAENQPVTSDKPVMIISGTNDPVVPPRYAELTASTLPNSFIVSYPRGGHVPSVDSPCLANAVAAYLNTPGSRPDTSCIAREAPRPFITPASASRLGFSKMIKKLSRTLPVQIQ
jgi:pimeloyl-ACP methyl ester carboxylesterase